jgi:hypothetical protein
MACGTDWLTNEAHPGGWLPEYPFSVGTPESICANMASL